MGGMQIMSFKTNLFAALIVGCAVAMTANTSFAWGHWRGGGSCGSHGGWGGSWGSGGSWGGLYVGSWGGSYGGGWGSCGSGGGYGYGYSGGYYSGGYASSRVISDGVVIASAKPAKEVKTRLTLHVPAEAKITLAGVETKQTGEIRQFATSRLAAGQAWDDYKVVVELTRDGKTLQEERTIKLVGGEAQDLSVNFDSTKIAQN